MRNALGIILIISQGQIISEIENAMILRQILQNLRSKGEYLFSLMSLTKKTESLFLYFDRDLELILHTHRTLL